MRSRTRKDDTFPCPNCGEEVPSGALSCPECGADEETGWSAEAEYDDLDLPSQEDDDDEPWSYEKENRDATTGIGPLWKAVAVLLLSIFLLGLIARLTGVF